MKRLSKYFIRRLIKKSFIGNINKSDIEISHDQNSVYCYIINEEKVVKDSYAGFIHYEFEPTDKELYVLLTKVKTQYKDTKIAMYMFKYFEENILNPLFDKYGKELSIGAELLNHDLAEFAERYCKKKGIKFINYNEHPSRDLYNDEHIEYLRSKGIEAEKKGGTIIIRNADFDLVVNAMEEIDYKTDPSGVTLTGVICDNGDIEYTAFEAMPPDNGIQFYYSANDKVIQFSLSSEELEDEIKKLTNLSNLNSIFSGHNIHTLNSQVVPFEQFLNQTDIQL